MQKMAVLFVAGLMAACGGDDKHAESADDSKVEKAAEDTEQAAEDASEKVGEKSEQAADKIEEAGDKAEKKTKDEE